MSERTSMGRVVDRRGFLKGSAMFAAAIAAAAATSASAQDQPAPPPEKKEEPPKKDEAPAKKPLIDKDGREYRVCEMCGANMYRHEKTWTCEQCGFSYEE